MILDTNYCENWSELKEAFENKDIWSFEDGFFYTENAFDMFEAEGFRDTFLNLSTEYNGKPFKVIRRLSYVEDDIQFEFLPAWLVEIDGKKIEAFPEEICKAFDKGLIDKMP